MNYLDELFTKENIENFNKFEKGLEEIAEKCDTNAFGSEDISLNNHLFKKNYQAFERFLEIVRRQKVSYKIANANGILSGNRTSGLVNPNRGNDLSVETTIYDSIEFKYSTIIEKNQTNICKIIAQYIKEHISELSTRGPGKRIIWSGSDEENYYKASGVDKSEILKIIKSSNYIDPSWQIPNKPINQLMTFQIFYFWNNMTESQKKNLDVKKSIVFYITLILAIKFYTSLNRTYFQYEVDEDLMTKTIEGLSDRYTIKNMKTVYELIEFIALTNINNTIELMEKPTDFNMKYYMDNLHNRINTTLKAIANEYYYRYDNGEKVATDKLQGTTEDGDTYMNIPESISADIETVTRKIAIKLSSDSSVSERILDISCRETKIGYSKMKTTIANMIGNDKDLIIDLIRKIITYYLGYLKKSKKTIHSINFISLMKRTYNVSNTKDKGLIDIKGALDVLMKRNSAEYLKTSRVATLSNMKACCFYYWLLYINEKAE